ncbi:MAG TPA: hypothetical protein VE961_23675 [Pyrinomonadaceae bacterium]|nr:hypothetical protein [Pyrinomonadaceae bacterium]
MVNDWLDDQLAEFRQEDDDRIEQGHRQRLIQQHTGRLYETLASLIKDAVEKINREPDFKKRVGQLDGEFVYTAKVRIVKSTYPAIYLTVERAPNTIDIHRLYVTNGGNRESTEHREALEVHLDQDGNPFLKNKDGQSLLPEEAVRYLFQPFFKPEILEQERTGRQRWASRSLGS